MSGEQDLEKKKKIAIITPQVIVTPNPLAPELVVDMEDNHAQEEL